MERTEKTVLERFPFLSRGGEWDDETVVTEITRMSRQSALVDLPEEEDTELSHKNYLDVNSGVTRKSLVQALPVMLGYLPLAFAFGIMAQEAHIPFFITFLMSFFVYAGASQYIAISLLTAHQPILSIVATTFIINLRHALLSASITPYLSRWSAFQRLVFSSQLTDEVFALHMTHYENHNPDVNQSILVNVMAHVSWLVGSILGFYIGGLIGDISSLGLDYALPAMFISILAIQIRDIKQFIVLLISGAFSLLFLSMGVDKVSIILTTLIGASAGLIMELWKQEPISY